MATDQPTSCGGIYAIRHVTSGRFYIGSAANIFARWSAHRRDIEARQHQNRFLQRAWDKYGAGAFVWEILETVDDDDRLLPTEQRYLDDLQPWRRSIGYNIARYASAPMRGRQHSPETRAKLSATHKGMKRSPEAVAKMTAKQRGRTLTAEHRAKIGAFHRGKIMSPESRAKMSAALKGRQHSAEHRAKIGAANRGRQVTDETRAKLSAILKGRKHSAETRAKMSESSKGRPKSIEHRANMSAANRRRWVRWRKARREAAHATLRERFGGPPCPWIKDEPATRQLSLFAIDDDIPLSG